MAALTIQQIAEAGIVPAYAAVTVADSFQSDGRTFLHVKNASGASINVTVTSQAGATPGLAQSNRVVAVAAGTERMIGPFPVQGYTDTGGLVQVAYSAIGSITAAALRAA